MDKHGTALEYGDEIWSRGETINKNVLIVDDDRLICWALKKLISSHDLVVTPAYSGKEAMTAVSGTPFRLAFLDVRLPDADGLQLLQEIKKISPETRVVVMTADSDKMVRQEALLGGAAHFIEKPFSISDIKNVLNFHFDLHPGKKRD